MSRIVIVLGRDPNVDIEGLIEQAWKENVELIIYVLGALPMSPGQQRICDAGLEAVGRGSILLEERLVHNPVDVARLIRNDDRVHLTVSRDEMKRIEAARRCG